MVEEPSQAPEEHDDEDVILTRPRKIAIAATAILLIVQIGVLIMLRGFLDQGHFVLTALYVVVTIITFFTMSAARYKKAIVWVVLCLVLVGVEVRKGAWNEDYVDRLGTGYAFMFDDYIDEYPTWEEYMIAPLTAAPDWIRFEADCARPALVGNRYDDVCRSDDAIEGKYNIDIDDQMDIMLRRMQNTAGDIADERLTSGRAYQNCVINKRCAPIPLLPQNADPEEVSEDPQSYQSVRGVFWDLVERRGLTSEICESMVLCQAMAETGAIQFEGGR